MNCMKIKCPSKECSLSLSSPKLIRKGFYYRTSDRHYVQRWQCQVCKLNFSAARFGACYWQKKRFINKKLFEYLASNNSSNRCAYLLGVNRKTIARRLLFLGAMARANQDKFRSGLGNVKFIQFDDLETIEHSKCKPLSVAIAVAKNSRIILGFSISQMPAKGLLAKRSVRKYGHRTDQRSQGWNELFSSVKPIVAPEVILMSDSNPTYPDYVKTHFPNAEHKVFKGGRGASTGQGELKRLVFDPLFTLNHTFAMLRANVCRLIRKTWCTTKKMERLRDHISIYVDFHNRILLRNTPRKAHS